MFPSGVPGKAPTPSIGPDAPPAIPVAGSVSPKNAKGHVQICCYRVVQPCRQNKGVSHVPPSGKRVCVEARTVVAGEKPTVRVEETEIAQTPIIIVMVNKGRGCFPMRMPFLRSGPGVHA